MASEPCTSSGKQAEEHASFVSSTKKRKHAAVAVAVQRVDVRVTQRTRAVFARVQTEWLLGAAADGGTTAAGGSTGNDDAAANSGAAIRA